MAEWLNENRYRRYPFVDDADTVLGMLEIPNTVLLDFQCTVTTNTYVANNVALVQVDTSPSDVALTFAVGNLSFTVVVPAAAATPYIVRGYTAELQYGLIFGEGIAELIGSLATYTGEIDINPVLVTVATARVDSITAVSHSKLSGAILVEPGYNVEPTVADNAIQLYAAVGAGAGIYCETLADVVSCNQAILWFCGQNASEDGNVQIVPGPGVQVDADADSHLITISLTPLIANKDCG